MKGARQLEEALESNPRWLRLIYDLIILVTKGDKNLTEMRAWKREYLRDLYSFKFRSADVWQKKK